MLAYQLFFFTSNVPCGVLYAYSNYTFLHMHCTFPFLPHTVAKFPFRSKKSTSRTQYSCLFTFHKFSCLFTFNEVQLIVYIFWSSAVEVWPENVNKQLKFLTKHTSCLCQFYYKWSFATVCSVITTMMRSLRYEIHAVSS